MKITQYLIKLNLCEIWWITGYECLSLYEYKKTGASSGQIEVTVTLK